MRDLRRILPLLPLLLVPLKATSAADQNGYTSKYECRAGGSECSVDVAALGARSCDQIVTPSTPWSSINWSNNTICLQAGDHTAKGVLTIPSSASGNAGNYKVLRYYRPNDNDDEPWNQGGNQATLRGIFIDSTDYLLIHRVTIDGNGTNGNGAISMPLEIGDKVTNLIINRILAQNYQYSILRTFDNGPYITIQNSVVRHTIVHPDYENQCIEIDRSSKIRIVNNEIYDCNKGISAGDGDPSIPDAKIENNDLYASPAIYTDCQGNYNGTGPCATNEALLSFKTGGLADQPVEIVHNRFWGARSGDGVLMGAFNYGEAFSISLTAGPQGYTANYALVKNNIIWDVQAGISNWWGTPHHISIIGNLIYKIRRYDGKFDVFPIRLRRMDRVEVYMNTIIDAPDRWLTIDGTDVNNTDVRCNVAIASGGINGSASSSTQIENNAFYAVPLYTTNNASNNIVRPNASDAAHVEYCFYRKLRTGAERVCIPNAKPTAASPHYQACDVSTGARAGIGILDSPIF